MNYALIILAVKQNKIIVDFLEKFYDYVEEKKLNYDIYLIIDDETKQNTYNEKINIIQVDNKEASKKGYKNSLLRYYHRKDKKIVSMALDKALYYFIKKYSKKYDYYWLIEDDVFIPTVETIPYIDKKYPDGDLLTLSNSEKENSTTDWHWPLMVRNNRNRNRKIRVAKAEKSKDYYLPLPWYSSFSIAIRISDKLLNCIEDFVKKNHTLIFMEFMFNTLAMQNNLKVVINENLKNRYEYNPVKPVWKFREIKKRYLYNFVKSFEEQKEFREKLDK